MIDSSISDKLKIMTGETNDDLLDLYYELAGAKIIEKAYPFKTSGELAVPDKYLSLQLDITVYLLNKRGAEGQIVHSENGISRTYENADVPENMLKRVIPMGKVM